MTSSTRLLLRPRTRLALTALAATLMIGGTGRTAAAQTLQYRSPAGVEHRSLPDTGANAIAIARAQTLLDADPRTLQRHLDLAAAQSAAWQFREAIETYSRAMSQFPGDVTLLRWRGHRWLSVREFTRAYDDLSRGYALDSTNYGVLFHLGVLHFVRGEFDHAATMFAKAQPHAPNAGEASGSTDWLWMSLSRAGRASEASAMLARRPDSLAPPPGYAYAQRLRLYRGELTPETLVGPADTAAVQIATLQFGLGNWYLVRRDSARAFAAFERAVASGGWPGFGFIAAEAELRRRVAR